MVQNRYENNLKYLQVTENFAGILKNLALFGSGRIKLV